MAFPINEILASLNNANLATKQPALYQVIKQLISASRDNQVNVTNVITTVNRQLSGSLTYGTASDRANYKPQSTAGNLVFFFESDTEELWVFADGTWYQVIGPLTSLTYLTATDETATLPNSRELVAGTNVTFDDTTPGQRVVNVTGSGTGTVTHTAGALTANQLVVGNGAADIKVVSAADGQIPIGKTSDGTVTLGNITAGPGIAITNGAASIIAALNTAAKTKQIQFSIGDGVNVLTTGIKADVPVEYDCTITAVRMLADQSGSVVVDIWKDTYANYPPTVADSITASAKPTISAALKSYDNTLTGWTTTLTAGDTLRFNIDSTSAITRLSLTLTVVLS